jgi:hypothetical protein
MTNNPELTKFDAVMRKIPTVFRAELQKREKQYKRKRERKKQAKL